MIGDPHFPDGIEELGIAGIVIGIFVVLGAWKAIDLIWMVL